MGPRIALRDGTEDDVESILAIVNHSILHTTSNYNYDVNTMEVQLEWFRDRVTKGFPIFVATDGTDGRVVGFGSFGPFREKKGYQYTVEHSVYVDKDMVGKGIGSLLLARLIEAARDKGLHCMIGVVDADNKQSIAFHEKFGFSVSGTFRQVGYKFDRWLDAVFMSLLLDKE